MITRWPPDVTRHAEQDHQPTQAGLKRKFSPLPSLDLTGIDWVIAGGESGPGHRPVNLDWIRDLRDRCARQNIAFFFKQVGGVTPKAGGRDLDGRTWDQMPELAGGVW